MFPRVLNQLILACLMTTTFTGAAVGQQQRKASNYPPKLPDAKQVVYKQVEDVQLKMYIYMPAESQPASAASGKRPAIVFFFGGGWSSGSPVQFETQAKHLAQRGMVAILADYRVKSRHDVQAIQCVEDAISAVRWVRQHADEYRIDTDRIVAAGGSAGGHLAACTATIREVSDKQDDETISPIPNALILFNPVVVLAPVPDQPELSQVTRRLLDSDLGKRLGTEPETISPFHHLRADLPPTIIFHGEADTTVPNATVKAYAKRSAELGNRCELVGYAGAQHGFFNFGRADQDAYQDTLRRTDEFLVSLGYLSPADASTSAPAK